MSQGKFFLLSEAWQQVPFPQKVLVRTLCALMAAMWVGMLPCDTAEAAESLNALKKAFASPPREARPWVYWFIMDGNVSREGITEDLESMQRAGIGGVIFMEVDVGVPRGPVAFMSEAWQDLFAYAVREAERLGIEITINAGPGWTGSGGPWVQPEQSMQHIVASERTVQGPCALNEVLPLPTIRAGFWRPVSVLAFPTPGDAYRMDNVTEKALYQRRPYSSAPNVKPYLPAPAEHPRVPSEAVIPLEDIRDLSDRVGNDGRIQWEVPAGSWTILRFVRTSTGQTTRPAPKPGLGLECDKMDREALDAHFEAFVGTLMARVGRRAQGEDRGWTMLHIDSWEMNAQNWTAAFAEEFRRRRGYDPIRYLPTVTGRVVGSLEQSERFLWDLRLTAQDLIIENHAIYLKELAEQNGFGLSIEPYDMNPTSDMVLGGVADVPMCEFWSQGHGFDTAYSCIEATSIAHTLGKRIVAAESFTAGSSEAWKLTPGAMKNQGDWAFCMGINRIVFHRFAHQPWLDRSPGMTMGPYGVHWDRTQTWWPMVSAYHRYVARCQLLLREGHPVADICYLAPEGAPHVFCPPPSALEGELGERRGYNFDGCTPGTLKERATVKDGRICFTSGASYSLLVLPSLDTMTPGLLQKVKTLVNAGATVVGSPPRKSPSLSDYPQCDQDVTSLAEEIWGGERPPVEPPKRDNERRKIQWGGARWIWTQEGDPVRSAPPCTRAFRRLVRIDPQKEVALARLGITADNAFQVWVNGQAVLEGEDFRRIFEADVAERLLPGNNLLAVEARNGGDGPNPAGLIASLWVEYRDGETVEIVTNNQWRSGLQAGGNWREAKDTMEDWGLVQELGPMEMAPWHLQPETRLPNLYPAYEFTAQLLASKGIPQDFESDKPVRYTHRRWEDVDLYFVSNRTGERMEAGCTFRVSDRFPELWDPLTGMTRPLPAFEERKGGRSEIPLSFEPYQSFFVVFRPWLAEAQGPLPERRLLQGKNFPSAEPVGRITGPWNVSFDPSLGGPGLVRFEALQDWRDREEPGIQYYSGIATYETRFDLPKPPRKEEEARLLLDLGEVHCLARVFVNGHDLGVVWCAPWRVDITGAVRRKGNLLQIEVANRWPNRLIRDSQLEKDQRVTYTTWNPYSPDAPLMPSGLVGPVALYEEQLLDSEKVRVPGPLKASPNLALVLRARREPWPP